jgi:hypothetical protein
MEEHLLAQAGTEPTRRAGAASTRYRARAARGHARRTCAKNSRSSSRTYAADCGSVRGCAVAADRRAARLGDQRVGRVGQDPPAEQTIVIFKPFLLLTRPRMSPESASPMALPRTRRAPDQRTAWRNGTRAALGSASSASSTNALFTSLRSSGGSAARYTRARAWMYGIVNPASEGPTTIASGCSTC